jgi:type IX secretion system PorP/SprF family membrane protein
MSTNIFNRASYNPASVSRPDYLYIYGSNKTQWVGVEGAPKVLNLQISDYYQPLHSALGLSFVNDVVGFTSFFNPMLIYSYKITDEENWGLAFGVAGGFFSRSFDHSLIKSNSGNDPGLNNLPDNILLPDANCGIEFQINNFTVGLSSTHILSLNNNSDSIFFNTNHRYAYAIYELKEDELINFSFAVQLNNRKNVFIADGTAMARFKTATGLTTGSREIFDLGLTYRTSNILSLMLGFYVLQNLRVGYVYDQSFNPNYSTYSTHEIMLEYRIPMQSASSCPSCNKQKRNR